MKEFALIFRATQGTDDKPSPEQVQERISWLSSIAVQEKLVSGGISLSHVSAKTIKQGNIVTDGPYAEIKEFISGYIIIKTETIEEAVELAKTNPIFKIGGNIEVRELINLYDKNLI
jgi:hypothetical protein